MQENIEATALAVRDETPQATAIGEHRPLRYSLPELRNVGEIMFQSGMFKDIKSVQQAMVKLLAGAELGYGPFQSLRAFHVIEGKPVETSGEVTARIKRSGKYRMESYFIDAKGEHLDPIKTKAAETNGCVVRIFERLDGGWHELEPTVFTKEDAAAAGLLHKQVWKSYLRDMLFARALTAAARRHCADIFGGPIYGPEEFGAEVSIDGNGEQVIVSPTNVTPTAPLAPPPASESAEQIESRRQKGIRDIAIFASNRGITDDRRHAIIAAVFEGKQSMKDLSLAELQALSKHLQAYVKDGMAEQPEVEFEAWLEFRLDQMNEAAHGW